MKRIVISCFVLLLASVSTLAAADDSKPYKEGPVTDVAYIKIKPGKFNDYMKFLAGPYKTEQEALKKAGLITGYAVFSSEARSPSDPDLILTVTYANMAALDKSEEAEAVSLKALRSTMATEDKAFADRGEMREVLGSQLIREEILK